MGMTASDVVGRRVNEIRKKRGWSLQRLADECSKAGIDRFTKNVLENIEYGRPGREGQRRREVTVEELLWFAQIFGTSVDALMMLPSCAVCSGVPPAGFACLTCSAESAS